MPHAYFVYGVPAKQLYQPVVDREEVVRYDTVTGEPKKIVQERISHYLWLGEPVGVDRDLESLVYGWVISVYGRSWSGAKFVGVIAQGHLYPDEYGEIIDIERINEAKVKFEEWVKSKNLTVTPELRLFVEEDD